MHPICVTLQGALKSLVDSKYEGNIKKASKYLDVDYYLLYRIVRGEQKSVSFFHAKHLVKVSGLLNGDAILQEYFPKECADSLEAAATQTQPDEVLSELRWALDRPFYYEVLLHCEYQAEVTEASVQYEFGAKGYRALKDLIDRKLFKIEDGKVLPLMPRTLWASNDICKKQGHMNISLLRLDQPGSYIRSHAAALNDEGIVEFYKAYRSFTVIAEGLENNEKYQGKNMIVSGHYLGPISTSGKEGEV